MCCHPTEHSRWPARQGFKDIQSIIHITHAALPSCKPILFSSSMAVYTKVRNCGTWVTLLLKTKVQHSPGLGVRYTRKNSSNAHRRRDRHATHIYTHTHTHARAFSTNVTTISSPASRARSMYDPQRHMQNKEPNKPPRNHLSISNQQSKRLT